MAEQSNKCKSGWGFPVFGLVPLSSPLPPESLWCPKISGAEPGCDDPAWRRRGSSGEGPRAMTTLSGLCLSLPGKSEHGSPHSCCKSHH